MILTLVTDQMVADYQRDGVVLVKGLWKDMPIFVNDLSTMSWQ